MHQTDPCVRSIRACHRFVSFSLTAILILSFTSTAQAEFCVAPDAAGTAELPPAGCEYTTPDGDIQIIEGLPAGTTIDIDAALRNFFAVVAGPGGNLGGEEESYSAELAMPMTGTDTLAGFNRNIVMQVDAVSHSAPRTPGDPVQTFDTDMFSLSGEVFGDPDFDTLRIIAGTNLVAASPGSTTLTRLGGAGSDWNVESFFDVTYTIDFQGAPGSVLEGFGGRTIGSVRFQLGMPVPEPNSAALCLVGLAALGTAWRRRRDS